LTPAKGKTSALTLSKNYDDDFILYFNYSSSSPRHSEENRRKEGRRENFSGHQLALLTMIKCFSFSASH
jgi:hypothetical protein